MKLSQFIGASARLAGLTAFVATAQAGSLTVGFQATIGSEQNDLATFEGGPYHLSVNPNNAGYASFNADLPGTGDPAPAFQRAFTGPVLGWAFIGGVRDVLTVGPESGGLITYTTTDTTFDGFAQNQLQLWTTSDPGSDLLNPALPRDSQGPGYRSIGDVAASIDITGLASGTVNIFYGSFRATPMVSAVMKDTDGASPDITVDELHLNGDAANRAEYYVAELEFVNDAGYDVIEYSYVDPGGNGRFGGTVLTGASAPPVAFEITEIEFDPAALPDPTVTLTWRDTGAKSYSAFLSSDLADWGEDLDDGITADADERLDDPGNITVTFALQGDRADDESLFFRIAAEPAN